MSSRYDGRHRLSNTLCEYISMNVTLQRCAKCHLVYASSGNDIAEHPQQRAARAMTASASPRSPDATVAVKWRAPALCGRIEDLLRRVA